MNNKTFNALSRVFGKSYTFTDEMYWKPDQKEYKNLKSKIEKLLEC